jgi:hypothetical protein
VTEGRLHVQALPARACEDHGRPGIDREAREGDGEHPAAEDLRRVVEPPDRLPDDPGAHQHEREAVDERREDLGALEAEAPAGAGRPAREGEGDERERDRKDVRHHVSCVGEEGEAARQQATDDLHDREGERQDEHDEERPAGGASVVARVRMMCRAAVGVHLAHR